MRSSVLLAQVNKPAAPHTYSVHFSETINFNADDVRAAVDTYMSKIGLVEDNDSPDLRVFISRDAHDYYPGDTERYHSGPEDPIPLYARGSLARWDSISVEIADTRLKKFVFLAGRNIPDSSDTKLVVKQITLALKPFKGRLKKYSK